MLNQDCLACEAFDQLESAAFVSAAKRQGNSGGPGAARTTDAVHVDFRNFGKLVVDHVRDVLDVESARRDIRGDQDGRLVGLELLQRARAGVLALVTVDGHGANSRAHQQFGDLVGAMLGASEDQCAGDRGGSQKMREQLRLVSRFDQIDRLPHLLGGRGHRVHLYVLRLVQPVGGQLPNFIGHRGGEHERLTTSWHRGHDASQIGQETHVEHLVCFIEDQHRDMRQVDVSLVH